MAHHRVVDHRDDGLRVRCRSWASSTRQPAAWPNRSWTEPARNSASRAPSAGPGTELLPGAFTQEAAEETERAQRNADGLIAPECVAHLVRTTGTAWRDLVEMCRADPSLADAVAPGVPVIRASVVRAVRREMARTLVDVVVRRTGLGAAGHPGRDVANACAWLTAHELGWDAARVVAELHDLRAFYTPVTVTVLSLRTAVCCRRRSVTGPSFSRQPACAPDTCRFPRVRPPLASRGRHSRR